MSSWTGTVEWQDHADRNEADVDEVLDALEGHNPAIGFERDGSHGAILTSVTLTLEAGSLRQATTTALQLVESAAGRKAIAAQMAPTWLFDQRVTAPSIPELVGYAEIADMAGVSRQRARQYTEISGFPVAVVETQSGPLRVRSSVEAWLERRGTPKPGRPAKAAATV